METDKRTSVRRPSNNLAKIIIDDASSINCTIYDTSENGFALKLNMVLGAPSTFTLFLPNTGATFDAEVVWKGPSKIGVSVQRVPLDQN